KEFDTYKFTNINPIETISGSNEVIINRKKHNYVVGSVIELSGLTSGNNITDVELNDEHTVIEVVNPDSFKIAVTSLASQNGFIGGANGEISTTIQASLLSPNIPNLTFPNTKVSYYARGVNGQSFDGLEVPYQVQ